MQSIKFSKIKAYTVGLVTFLILGFLTWEHFHGGVVSHHILQQKDLPSISNWWGGILLPVLTWFLLSRTEKRLDKEISQTEHTNNSFSKVFWIFLTALVFGILISISFTNAYKPFLDNVPYILIVLSFIIPIYYSEFILGFIIGMTYTFGAILPTVFILIIAAVGLVAYRFIRPLFLRPATKLWNRINKSSN